MRRNDYKPQTTMREKRYHIFMKNEQVNVHRYRPFPNIREDTILQDHVIPPHIPIPNYNVTPHRKNNRKYEYKYMKQNTQKTALPIPLVHLTRRKTIALNKQETDKHNMKMNMRITTYSFSR